MSDYRDPSDPMYRYEPAGRTGIWGWLTGCAVFLVVILGLSLGLALGVGHMSQPVSHRIMPPPPMNDSTGGALYGAQLDPAAVTSSQSAVTRPHNVLERSRHKGPLFCLNDPQSQLVALRAILGRGLINAQP